MPDSSHNSANESEVLSAAVRNRDHREVKRLVTAHREYLKRVVTLRMDRRLQARVDASDVVQEAQLEAVQRVEEYVQNPKLPVRLWLRRLACDALVDAQRRHIYAEGRSVKRELDLPEQSSIDIAKQLLAGISSPSVRLSRKEMAEIVREAVMRLPEADQEILMLIAFEGLSSTEAGQLLEIEPAAARKRYGRALLKLQNALRDCEKEMKGE